MTVALLRNEEFATGAELVPPADPAAARATIAQSSKDRGLRKFLPDDFQAAVWGGLCLTPPGRRLSASGSL